jgi:hypothetical protein
MVVVVVAVVVVAGVVLLSGELIGKRARRLTQLIELGRDRRDPLGGLAGLRPVGGGRLGDRVLRDAV